MNKSKLHIYFLLGALMFSSVVFSQHVENPKYERKLKRLLPKNVPIIDVKDVDTNDQTILFIDSRNVDEYLVSHIENSICYWNNNRLPLDSIAVIPKNTKIIVYCTVGYRSAKTTKTILAQGFTDVSNLYGGIIEWNNQKMPLVNTNGESTTDVHTYNKKFAKWATFGTVVY